VSGWEREYLPGPEHVVGGLTPELQAQVERIADTRVLNGRVAEVSDIGGIREPTG
jgi:hypothetical protein